MDQVLISFEVDPWLLLSPVPAPMQMLQAALGALAEINPADLPEDQALAMGAGLVASQDQLQALALLERELAANAAAPLPQLTRLEFAFLRLARHVARKHLRDALAVLVNALLPNELADRAEDAHRNRGLELVRDVDGQGWRLRGWLDDECGELLQTCLTAAMEKDPDNVADTAAAAAAREEGEPVDLLDPQAGGCTRPRSRTQRRHDALQLILQKLLDSKALGSRNKMPVQIGVTISVEALHGQPGGLPARTDSGAIVP